MADKQLLLKQNAGDGFFADNDPLAELARIASFDPQGEVRPKQSNQRREPEFNLEDELLKEFEQYEAPQEADMLDEPRDERYRQTDEDPSLAAEPQATEPVHLPESEPGLEARPEPELAAQPERDLPDLRAVPEPQFEAPAEQFRPQSHPVFDLEDEILREFAAFDARRSEPTIMAAAPAPLAAPAVETYSAPVQPPVYHQEPQVLPEPDPVLDHRLKAEETALHEPHSGYGDEELAPVDEQIAYDPSVYDAPALDAMEAEFDAIQWHELKEPLFESEQAVAEPADAVDEPDYVEPAAATQRRWEDEVSVEPAAETLYRPVEVEAEPPSDEPEAVAPPVHFEQASPSPLVPEIPEPPVVQPRSMARHNDYGLDALLADVERYPVAAPQVSRPEPVAEGPTFATVEPALPVIDRYVPAKEPSTHEPLPEAAAESFDDGAFELDLTEIELDMLEMEAENAVAAAAEEPAIVASPAVIASVAKAVVEERTPYMPERYFVPAPRIVEDYSSLPFDPSQIAGDEDQVEAMAEMNVPEVAVVEHVAPLPVQSDYDIDIDAEMAHIFARPSEPAARPSSQQAASKPAPAAVATPTDLDEFERALEEDFRRSMSENRASSTPDRVALTPAAYDNTARESTVSRRLMVLAASVAGLVLIGGAGVYAYWGSSGNMLSTASEPKIILADKDPVKIQPTERGGRTVPNQDKMVYDRVSGDDKDIAKQERLVTSHEEPVDVVQKTLMPENLPMDDEDIASGTDPNDTTDPRLLPQGQDKNITATEKVVSGVSPRKVRTMVVRSDGTLVARDELVADDKDAASADTAQGQPLDTAAAVAEDVPERLADNDAVAKQIEEASADSKAFTPLEQVQTQEQPALKTDPADVADAVPMKTEEIAAAAPVADDANDEAIRDAASASVEETAPIRTVTTTKITGDTPIPQNRPADQPVDIVGTVTDQGNVRKPQELATAAQTTDSVQTSETPAGTYVIQIASLPTEADAQASYTKLSSKFASVIGGRSVDIKRADIKNKGTYYRVRISAGTRQEATDLCLRYKAAGGSCLVSR